MTVLANWMYDYGEYTGTALSGQSAVAIDSAIASARAAAVTMIATGDFGPTGHKYRVIARASATAPSGYSIEITDTGS